MNTMNNDGAIALSPATTALRAGRRQAPATLGKLTAGALAGLALALGYVQVAIIGELAPDLMVFAGLLLLGAGLIGAGLRWAPLAGALLSIYADISRAGALRRVDPSTRWFLADA